MSRACSTCGSSDIDFDPSRGDTVCTNCGSVLEESVIVSEIGFQENSAGGASVIGQFVSNEGNKVGQGLGFRPGVGRESRTVTLENGRRRIQAIANQLQLNNHCVESAYMFFKLAVSKRLTKGRRTNHVAAACLYLVCRTEKTPHLLIDFSDILQVEVMVLGRIFLKLQHELCINLPVIDPCLYIHRFSHQFQLGDKEHEVTNTALRMVSRMKRDWIQYGRRPSGLCGAALLVSARLHGFSRTVKQVVKIVRLSNTTIRKRLTDFQKTPSGQLTIDEFNTIDLEEEQDPPCFTKGRQRQKQQQLDEVNGLDKLDELEELRHEIESVLTRNKVYLDKENAKCLDSPVLDQPGDSGGPSTDSVNKDNSVESDNNVESCNSGADTSGICSGMDTITDNASGNTEKQSDKNPAYENSDNVPNENEGTQESNEKLDGSGDTGNVLDSNEVVDEVVNKTSNEHNANDGNNEDCSEVDTAPVDLLDDLDDDELDAFILTAPEVEVKTKIWMEENKEYLEKLKEKEEREALEREKEENDPTKKKRRKPYKKRPKEKANSVGEAVEKMLIEKRISHKINYDVLRNLKQNNELEKPSSEVPETPTISEPPAAVSGLLQVVQPSIPVRYKGRKRDTNILPRLPTKRVKFSDAANEADLVGNDSNEVPLMPVSEGNASGIVVESGPVVYEQEQEDLDDDDEDHMTAAQYMGQDYGGLAELYEVYGDEY